MCDSPAGEQVRAGLWDGQFLANLAAVLPAICVFIVLAVGVHLWLRGGNLPQPDASREPDKENGLISTPDQPSVLLPGLLPGLGLGGFLDSIVLHQLLQTHSIPLDRPAEA